MNNLEVPDDLLMIACGEARDIYLNSVVKPLDIYEHDFSLRFEARMHKLIRKTKNSKKPGQVFWRVAAAIIIFLSVSFASLMSVEAYREKILEIITSVFKDRTDFDFFSDKEPTGLEKVILEYIPSGFEQESSVLFGHVYQAKYRDESNRFFDLHVHVYDKNTVGTLSFDTEEAEVTNIECSFGEALVIAKNGETTVFWTEDNVVYSIRGNIEKEELIRICEKVSIFLLKN